MRNTIKQIIAVMVIATAAFGQFKTDVSDLNLPSSMHSQPSAAGSLSWLDPSRFDMQHSFSVSMMQLGGYAMSVGSYTNQMSYLLKDNLKLRMDFTLMQPNMFSATDQTTGFNGDVYYRAGLDYQPTENTFLQIEFGNYPTYQRWYPTPFESGYR